MKLSGDRFGEDCKHRVNIDSFKWKIHRYNSTLNILCTERYHATNIDISDIEIFVSQKSEVYTYWIEIIVLHFISELNGSACS